MDFWDKTKSAFQKTYLSGMKRKLITMAVVILLFIIFIAIIVGVIIGDDEYGKNTDESMISIGKDYVVNTSISEADIIVTDESVLENAINSLEYSEQEKMNLIDNIDAFLGIQQKYNVNAVFAMAVTIVESGAGTGWAAIDPSTYNWCSMTAGSSWTGKTYRNPTSSNERTWRVYNSFSEATYDFGKVISNSTYYFGGENYTVSSIAPSYCNAEWGKKVIDHMTDIFEACGIDTSKYNSISVTGNAIVDKSAELYKRLYTENFGYNMGTAHSAIPHGSGRCAEYSGAHFSDGGRKNHKGIIDCSAFVDWVLIELGEQYGEKAYATSQWGADIRSGALNKKGWTVFNLSQKSDYNNIQPGDIWINIGTHMFIIGEVYYDSNREIQAMSYDAGNENNWLNNRGEATQSHYIRNKPCGSNYWIIRISNINEGE